MSSNAPTGYLSPAEALALMPDAFAEAKQKTDAARRRAAWLNLKRGKFGASAAGKLLTTKLAVANNMTSRGYIAQKAAELAGVALPEIGGPALRWGNENEAAAMETLMERAGIVVTHYGEEQEWLTSDFSDQVGSTWDGRASATWQGERYMIPVETKCCYNPGEHIRYMGMVHGEELADQNHEYYAQVQAQIMTADVLNPGPTPYGIFAVYDPRHPDPAMQIGWWLVSRDQTLIDAYKARLVTAIQERDQLMAGLRGLVRDNLKDFLKQ